MAWFPSGVREHLRSGLAWGHRCHILRPRNGIETLPTPLGSPHTRAQNDGLIDTDSCAILDIYCSAHWPHDTQTGRRVALRNTEKIESLVGDKGYDDQSLRDALRSEGVRPLLRTITPTTHGWTASYTASAGWPRPPFRPSSVGSAPLSPSHLVPRIPRTCVDRRSLQPRTSAQTVTPTPSSDSTKHY